MANYQAPDTDFQAVANAIRTKGGTQAQLEWPTGFVNAISSIPTGGGSTIIAKPDTIVQNGTYYASADSADGYSQVTVNVSGGGGTVFANWDFTSGSLVDSVNGFTATLYGNATLDSNGVNIGTSSQGVGIPDFLNANMRSFEFETGNMITGGPNNNGRLLKKGGSFGIVWRSNHWAMYCNSTPGNEDLGITDYDYFANSKIRVYVNKNEKMELYKDDILIYTSVGSFNFFSYPTIFGGDSWAAIGYTIKKVRCYD